MASSDIVLVPRPLVVVASIFGLEKIKKQGEFMGIILLLLYEKKSEIHGFILVGRAPYYHPSLRAGSVVRFSGYEVARSLANTNLELPVVVGQFQSVQSLDLKDATVMSQVVVHFVIEPVVCLGVSSRAESVMVVTTVNPIIFGGNIYLSSTPATKFYFDLVLQAITDLEGPVGEVFPCIDTKDEEIKKKEVVSIGNLNKFISNSDYQVLQQNDWSFVSCSGCSRELEKSGTSLRCNRCVNPNVTEVIKEMLKLTKQDAAVLTLDEMNVGGGEELPQCLKELAGKYFVFQIRVKPFNFTPNPVLSLFLQSLITSTRDFQYQ
ncbi:BnaC04g13230D [Brassica napus]|uniref:BnaC04g13230D protein n=1 Tax=Brassica napus TaxID=3708 RepID=A0A078H9Q4_BRANA|nr:BnaC04g13230D [Brassica napus]